MPLLEHTIEAVLFYKGEPIKISTLISSLEAEESAVTEAIQKLHRDLAERGIRLVQEGEYVGLATSPECAPLIEKIRKDELEGPLGRAGLETLAIIIYQGASTRADIEYIRGVNSSSILRSLTIRGLIERLENPSDKRSFLYRATPELPATLGVSSLTDIPQFSEFKKMIEDTLQAKEEAEKLEEGTP